MSTLDNFKIDLKGMRTESQDFQFVLDDFFFVAVQGNEIQKGALTVGLNVKKTFGFFKLSFRIKGTVEIPCDRCLENMEQEIDTDSELKVKLGDEFSDEGEWVIVTYDEGFLNVAWYIYEFIALAIPIKHVHEDGKCNETMTTELQRHLAFEAEDVPESENNEPPVDPRWNELKKILDNN